MPGPHLKTTSRGAEQDDKSCEVFVTPPPPPPILSVITSPNCKRKVLLGSQLLNDDDSDASDNYASDGDLFQSSDPENDSSSESTDGSAFEDKHEEDKVKFFVDLPVHTFEDFQKLEDDLKEKSGTRKALVSKHIVHFSCKLTIRFRKEIS